MARRPPPKVRHRRTTCLPLPARQLNRSPARAVMLFAKKNSKKPASATSQQTSRPPPAPITRKPARPLSHAFCPHRRQGSKKRAFAAHQQAPTPAARPASACTLHRHRNARHSMHARQSRPASRPHAPARWTAEQARSKQTAGSKADAPASQRPQWCTADGHCSA